MNCLLAVEPSDLPNTTVLQEINMDFLRYIKLKSELQRAAVLSF